MKPRILVLANQRKENYQMAIEKCGAIAALKYLPDKNVDYDGLVICGGNDIHPAFYNQKVNGAFDFDVERDKLELELVKLFIDTGKPILGICRGHQLLNVALGGTLIQDLEEKSRHVQNKGVDQVHQICTLEGSMLNTLYGNAPVVNSSHHQGIDKLGLDLVATSFCDGVIESIEHKSKPYFGVQFHPERMLDGIDTVNGIRIFEYFVDICKSNNN